EGLQLLEEEPQNWPPRIRCSDACDPLSLESNHTRCLHRIRQALQHYRDLLGSDIFREQPQPQLETTMEQLLRHVQDGHGRPPRHLLAPTDEWEQPLQRHLALKRLRSFAAVISRVFNHGAR
ncbi:IL23A protein, partial [Urocynchramus pylzowi]|nr:IL23A protein [Urocynchramus pylzowi]